MFEKDSSKSDCAADGSLFGGNPNAIKQNTGAGFDSKIADVGNPLVTQFGRYLR